MSENQKLVLFLSESVFQELAHALIKNKRGSDDDYADIIEFYDQIIFENTDSGKNGDKITFTTPQVLQSARSEEYAKKVKNTVIGKPFVYTVENPQPGSKFKINNLAIAAHDKHAEIEGEVKVVAATKEEINELDKFIDDKDYPIEVVDVNTVLELCEENEMMSF